MLFFFEMGFLVLAVVTVVAGEFVGPRMVLGPALALVLLSWVAWEFLGRRPYAQAVRAGREPAPLHRMPLPEDVVNGWLHVNKLCVLAMAGLAVWALLSR